MSDGAKRVSKYSYQQNLRGLKRVSVWVPECDVERVKIIAAKLRAGAKLKLPGDEGGNFSGHTPSIKVPVLDEKPKTPKTVFLEIGPGELGLHMLLRTNRGVWRGQRGLWEVPAYLPRKLGLTERVRG